MAEDGGYTETATPAKLELTLNMSPGLDFLSLNEVKSEDVTVRLADGHVHMLSQAFTTEVVPIEDGTGKVTIMSNTSEQIS